ncbi:MAG: N-acetylmuramoyl-L-alanine amidase [Verrucomicrobiia bacterium]
MIKPCAWLKMFAQLLVLGLVFGRTPAHAAYIIGQNYVSVADWARANGLKCAWLKRGDEVVATNRTARLVFDKDSRLVEVNGTEVALSFPVAADHGVLLIAQMDLNTAVRPLLYPPRFTDARRVTTICLDPGHGGRDTGNHTFWRSEKTYTLALALEMRAQLLKAGFNVILTRNRDTYVELPDRPALANRRGADLFVSLHFNATPTGKNEVQGPQTYCITPVGASSTDAQGEGAGFGVTVANRVEQKSLLLAYQVQKSLVQNLGVPDRGVRRARFAVLRDATMPAILIEGGYMTHPAESKRIYSAVGRSQMAQSIVKGILAYQRLVSPPPPPSLNRPAGKNPPAAGTGANKIPTNRHTQ